jgi:hypothetical protein
MMIIMVREAVIKVWKTMEVDGLIGIPLGQEITTIM